MKISMENMYIHMGQLVRPHGIFGEIVLDWYSISLFSSQTPFWIQKKSETPKHITITSCRPHNGRILVRIEGITDRTQAERYRGYKLLVKREELPPPGENEAYISDLLGSEVCLADGTLVGRFSYVLENTNGNVWSILTETNQEIFFPAQPQFLLDLNWKDKKITIDPPDGLLDLYLSQEKEDA